MKKIILAFKAVVLLLLLQSCKDYNTGPIKVIPNCSWDITEQLINLI